MGHVCPWWFAYTFDNPIRPLFHNPEKIFGEYVKEGMHVADIGCGLGYFSLGLARMVGEKGKVIAADVQPQMLQRMQKRAEKAGLSSIIHPHQCSENNIDIHEPLDFALAFWVIHETPAPSTLFQQLHEIIKPNGILFFAEPVLHVIRKDFQQEITLASQAGFRVREKPWIWWSRAAALSRNDKEVLKSE